MPTPKSGVATTVSAKIHIAVALIVVTLTLASCSRNHGGLLSRPMLGMNRFRPGADAEDPRGSIDADAANAKQTGRVASNSVIASDKQDDAKAGLPSRLLGMVYSPSTETETEDAPTLTGKVLGVFGGNREPAARAKVGQASKPADVRGDSGSQLASRNRFVSGFDSQLARLQANLRTDSDRTAPSTAEMSQENDAPGSSRVLMGGALPADGNPFAGTITTTSASETASSDADDYAGPVVRPRGWSAAAYADYLAQRPNAQAATRHPFDDLPEWGTDRAASDRVEFLPPPDADERVAELPEASRDKALFMWLPVPAEVTEQVVEESPPQESSQVVTLAAADEPIPTTDPTGGQAWDDSIPEGMVWVPKPDSFDQDLSGSKPGRVHANRGMREEEVLTASFFAEQQIANRLPFEMAKPSGWVPRSFVPEPTEFTSEIPTGNDPELDAINLSVELGFDDQMGGHQQDDQPHDRQVLSDWSTARFRTAAGLSVGVLGLIGIGIWCRLWVRDLRVRPSGEGSELAAQTVPTEFAQRADRSESCEAADCTE